MNPILVINEYQIEGGPGELNDIRLRRMQQPDGRNLWALYNGNEIVSCRGVRHLDALPSERDDEYMEHHRFATPGEALAVFLVYADEIRRTMRIAPGSSVAGESNR